MSFIPDAPPGGLGYKAVEFKQACLEDGLAGYSVRYSAGYYQAQIIDLLTEHGATEIGLTRGTCEGRTAFRLRFLWCGVPIEIIQVALPTRVDTKRTRDLAANQALYHLLNEIRMELERRHFHPELPAFVPYMLAPMQDGRLIAVWQLIRDAQQPSLPSPVKGNSRFVE